MKYVYRQKSEGKGLLKSSGYYEVCISFKRAFKVSTLTVIVFLNIQFSSVAKSCLTLCDPVDCSTPGLQCVTNSRSLLRLMSIKSVMPSIHLISSCPLLLPPSIFLASGSFQMSQLFTSVGPSIGVSVSTSVLPVNIQD